MVLVSGAAGATGSIVGSIAKIKGASKVIGYDKKKKKRAYKREGRSKESRREEEEG